MNSISEKRDTYIKLGLLFAAVGIGYQLLAYIIGIDFYASFTNAGLTLLVSIGLLVAVTLQMRKANGGFAEFKTLFLDLFFVLVAGVFLTTLFDFVLNTAIDPDLPVKVIDESTEKTMAMMEGMVPEEELDKTYNQLQAAKEEVKDKYTFGGLFMTYFTSLAIWMIPALIMALIFKKEPSSPFNDLEA
jgi:hypothetical protein